MPSTGRREGKNLEKRHDRGGCRLKGTGPRRKDGKGGDVPL